METHDGELGLLTVEPCGIADLAVDLWRIQRRARRDGVTDAVLIACETAVDRLAGLGFQVREMVGEPYHENLRVRVVHQEGGKRGMRITECLSPAIYFRDQLIRPAEVVIEGEE